MGSLSVEEFDFFLAFLGINFSTRCFAIVNSLELALELNHFLSLFLLFVLQFTDAFLNVSLAVLSLQLLPHGKSHGTKRESDFC